MKNPRILIELMYLTNLITGAFSFSGRYIAEELIKLGEPVETMTGHPDKLNPYYKKIKVKSFLFNDFNAMVENFKGVETFYNSYWIRFPYKTMSWKQAIINCNILFKACKKAGVKKIVHISVTNNSLDSPYSYFKGKAVVEELLKRCGVPYTILRIAWFFEDNDILCNDIAWIIRRFPIFGLFGDGKFKLQPVSARTLSQVAVESRYRGENTINTNKTINVIGPETYTWQEFISAINNAMGTKTLLFPFPSFTIYIPIFVSTLLGLFLKDRLLTIEEINSLKDNLCLTNSPPIGTVSFKKWLEKNKLIIGRKWNGEIKRHYY